MLLKIMGSFPLLQLVTTRWQLIKMHFSKSRTVEERRSMVRRRRGIRQRWYWEHLLRNERDYDVHMDYVHFNPVKHGCLTRAGDWPYTTLPRLIKAGVYPTGWTRSIVMARQPVPIDAHAGCG